MVVFDRNQVIKPGFFNATAAANTRRFEFDFCNESLMAANIMSDVVFIGDSIIHFWELNAYFHKNGQMLINRGIGGDTSSHVKRRFEADVLQLNPKLAVMEIGSNDLGWKLEQLDDGIVDKVCKNIESMAEEAHYKAIQLALCSILPIWGAIRDPLPEFIERKNRQIVAANDRIKIIANHHNAIYVDYHSHMLDDAGLLPHNLSDDGMHPHFAGYTIMADVLRKTLAGCGIEI